VMDMDHLKMRNATKSVLDFYKLQGQIDEANYPETLCKILIINASWVFLTIWKFAKFFFDDEIRQKVNIVGSNYEKELFEYIDPSQVPTWLKGGRLPASEEWMGDLAYMNQIADEEDKSNLTKVQVAAGKYFDEVIQIHRANDVIAWDYCTEKHNIKFSVLFGDDKDSLTAIIPEEKSDSCTSIVSGRHTVDRPGCYVLRWSNEYSMMKGKTLFYKVYTVSESNLN